MHCSLSILASRGGARPLRRILLVDGLQFHDMPPVDDRYTCFPAYIMWQDGVEDLDLHGEAQVLRHR